MSITVDGQQVNVGDCISFKSDVEQYGTLTSYKKSQFGGYDLTLENENGFDGGYIGGDTVTTQHSDDCWVE